MSLYLAAALLVQEPLSDENVLKKIVDSIGQAKTVRVKFSGEYIVPDPEAEMKRTFKGELLLKEGNKTRLRMEGGTDAKNVKTTLWVCDGTRLSEEASAALKRSKDPARLLHEGLKVSLARFGVFFALLGFALPRDQDPEFHQRPFEPGELQVDRSANTVFFRLERTAVKNRYDPKDFKLLKRSLEFDKDFLLKELNETYEEFTLNADLPDGEFKIP
jgi:hypothetical protein